MSDHTTLHDVARLRAVLTARLPTAPKWVAWVEGVVEELAGADAVSVDATPPQGIDRDELLAILMEQWTAGPRETAGRILALVRPVEGVVLSPEEAILARQGARVLAGLNDRIPGALDPELAERFADLVSRLGRVA